MMITDGACFMLTFAFYKAPGRFADRAIRFASGSRYSHVEFLLSEPTPVHRYTACVSASKRDGNKVRTKPMQMHKGHWDILTIRGNHAAARKYALGKCNPPVPYNMLGAVLSVTPCRAQVGSGLFCSEFMALICDAGGVVIPDPHTLHPGELFEALMARGASLLIE